MKTSDQLQGGASWGGEDLYFCVGDQCMTPLSLKKLRYGCAACESAKLMTSEAAEKKGIPISARVFGSRVLCEEHHLPIIPRCTGAACAEPIRAEATGRPIRLVGGEHSGKTVYSAVLAHELLDPGFFQATGVSVARIKGDAYLRQTVRPLYEHGVPPAKTAEPHKIVFRLVHDRGPAEIMQLHDMPGELAPTATIGYFSDKTLFLVNPQAVSTPTGEVHPLAGLVPGHTYWSIAAMTERLAGMGWLDTASEASVQSVCNQVTGVLQDRGWPNCSSWDDVAWMLLETARNALGRSAPADEPDRQVFAHELEGVAEGLRVKPNFTDQFDAWVDAMRTTAGASVADRVLAGHRLALVFSKADLLGRSAKLDQLFRTPTHAEAGSPKVRRIALQNSSAEARHRLLELGLGDLVHRVEQQVGQVGFFFVSSLGRATEARVKRLDPVAAGTAAGGGHQLVRHAKASPVPTPSAPTWEVTEVLSLGPDGTRAPTPRGVVNPLQWLLLG